MIDHNGYGVGNGYWPTYSNAYPPTCAPPNTHTVMPSWPSHVTHSWLHGLGADPMLKLAEAMDRLAAAIEKQNEQRKEVA